MDPMNSYNEYSTQDHTQQANPTPQGTPALYRPCKKRGIGTKGIVAIILCCAVLFGGIGFGSAWFMKEYLTDSSATTAEVQEPTNTTSDTESPADSNASSDLALKMAKEEEGALTIPEITEKSADSVVEITTETVQTGTMLQQYISSGAGSGVIVTEDGYIVTNNHVIEGATNITVTLRNGETYPAELIGLDAQLDVALLKIEAPDLHPASIGTSSGRTSGVT